MAEIRQLRRSEAWRDAAKKYSSTALLNEEVYPLVEAIELEKRGKP